MANYKRTPLAERFAQKVHRTVDLTSCWLWTGSVNTTGYGQISRGGRRRGMTYAHRVAWELAHGPIPPTLCVLHACDQRRCVRVGHLFLGTKADNTQDMIAKERKSQAILTAEQVRFIRSSTERSAELAARLDVTVSTIAKVRRRTTWKHLP